MDGPLPWTQQGFFIPSGKATSASFDEQQERLWVGGDDGFLSSVTLPDLQLYSATRTCYLGDDDSVEWSVARGSAHVDVTACASGVAVANGLGLRLYDRGGLLDAEVPATAFEPLMPGAAHFGGRPPAVHFAMPIDTHDGATGAPTTLRLVVGGTMDAVHLIDADRLFSGASVFSAGSSAHARLMAAGASGFRSGTTVTHGGKAPTPRMRSIACFPVRHAVTAAVLAEGRALAVASGETGKQNLRLVPLPRQAASPHVGRPCATLGRCVTLRPNPAATTVLAMQAR